MKVRRPAWRRGTDEAAPERATDDTMWRRQAPVVEPADRSSPLLQRPCLIVMVVLRGVIVDEAEAFRSVLRTWPGCEFVVAGREMGPTPGAAGSIVVDALFRDIDNADIVVVPGGIGVQQAANDELLLRWLRNVSVRARWILASSTGSVLVAAADLLDGHEAATHWLAGELLGSFGSSKTEDRLSVQGRVVTCASALTALQAACHVIEAELGPEAAAQALAASVQDAVGPARQPRFRRRRRSTA